MSFKERTDNSVCLCSKAYLGAWGSGQTQKCINSILLSGIEEGLIVLETDTGRTLEADRSEDELV